MIVNEDQGSITFTISATSGYSINLGFAVLTVTVISNGTAIGELNTYMLYVYVRIS